MEPLSYRLISEVGAILNQGSTKGLESLKIHDILYSFVDTSGYRSVLTTNPLLLDINFCKRKSFKLEGPECNLRLATDPGTWRSHLSVMNAPTNRRFPDYEKDSALKEKEAGLYSVGLFSRNIQGTREVFELYSHQDDPLIVESALFSNRELLENFYQFFLDRSFSLRQKIKKEPLVKSFTIPKEEILQCNIPSQIFPLPTRRYFLNGQDERYLTGQEVRCLHLLFKCRSTSQIGTELGISSRTVEHYLDQVKLKFNCSSKAELYDVLTGLGFKAP